MNQKEILLNKIKELTQLSNDAKHNKESVINFNTQLEVLDNLFYVVYEINPTVENEVYFENYFDMLLGSELLALETKIRVSQNIIPPAKYPKEWHEARIKGFEAIKAFLENTFE